ncbi:MAG: glycine oxidase ThiO [Ardenticatenales bacterium]|nr:glycine oxidase ThiO [Ardenticatenales bacterium]
MITIIGAGMIGLSLGWRLAQAGQQVSIFERGQAGQEASWAAAGMVAPGADNHDLLTLMMASRAIWPAFAAELEAAAGQLIDYCTTGHLSVALDETSHGLARSRLHEYEARGWDASWLTGSEARALEPALSPAVTGACLNRYWHFVNNRLANQALLTAFQQAGGQLHEGMAVSAIQHRHGRVTGLVVNGEDVPAETLVLAAGAWSDLLADLPAEAGPRIKPVKGEMFSLKMPPGEPIFRHMISRPAGVMVAHRAGDVVIGGSKLPGRRDKTVHSGTLADLLQSAHRYIPALRELPFGQSWAGIRPGTEDGLPYLGPTPLAGLYLATGHYMDGILLAPITAQLMSETILSGQLPADLAPFQLARHAGT